MVLYVNASRLHFTKTRVTQKLSYSTFGQRAALHCNRPLGKWAGLAASVICVAASTVALSRYTADNVSCESVKEVHPLVRPTWTPGSREEMLRRVTEASADAEEFDLLIIGGGATGAGCAVDAASRGLKVLCVEKDDFGCGTSSRSTKLVHGGVRYLEKAIMELDWEQYKLVKEALYERGTFLKVAPHLAYELPIMVPIKEWYKVPYIYIGTKVYDLLAASQGQGLKSSYFLSRQKAKESFPMLDASSLYGAMVYYDGAQNDSRMNITLMLSAVEQGAVALNHTEVLELVKANDKITGAVLRDNLTGEELRVKCKGVINATGPFTDAIRKMDEPTTPDIVAPSAGVHLILPNYYTPSNLGLLDPATSDGRVVFFLPWQGSTIVGTTDSPSQISANPTPSEEDIRWILNEVKEYFNGDCDVQRDEVLAAWSGIRPLVRDPHARSTQALVRSHVVHISPSGLLTIAGGKWTTYRAMAADAVDAAVQHFKLAPSSGCVTDRLPLVGAANYHPSDFLHLVKQYGLATDVAQHLSSSYGDRAVLIAEQLNDNAANGRRADRGERLVSGYPYLEAEVKYACQQEFAHSAMDVLSRRLRLAFLNAEATLECLPRVIDIMGSELNWSAARKRKEWKYSVDYLRGMGLKEKLVERALKSPPCFRKGSITGPVHKSEVPWFYRLGNLFGFGGTPFNSTPTQKLTYRYFQS